MAEKGFGIKQLDIIGSTGTPLVESKAGLNIRLAGQGPNGIGYTVGIGTTGLATWLTTKNNADPDNVTTLNCGIITANYIYGTFDGNISGGNGLTNITVDYTGRNAPCAMPITISAPSTGTKQINIPDNSNAFGAKYVQDSEPTGTSVCDGDIWYDTSSTGGSGGGITIEDEGTALSTIATTLNFVGSGVVASGTGAEKTITISGGGGGGTPDTPLNSFQFNESSSFGGADHFKYDSTTGGVVFDDGNTPADASKTLKLYTNNRSYIDSAGTDLHLRLTSTNSSQHIKLEPGGSHTGLKVTYQGSVEAYYNNSKKIETQDEGISIYGGGSVGAGILFYEGSANGTNKINIKSPAALAADYTLTLPADDGDADEVLKTDGSGVLSWVAQSGGGGISGITIKDEGSALSTLATTLNFAGAGVVASGTGAVKTITIAGGGGSLASRTTV